MNVYLSGTGLPGPAADSATGPGRPVSNILVVAEVYGVRHLGYTDFVDQYFDNVC